MLQLIENVFSLRGLPFLGLVCRVGAHHHTWFLASLSCDPLLSWGESHCKAKFISLSIQPCEKCNNKADSFWYSPIRCKLSRPFPYSSGSELCRRTITEAQLYLLKECSTFISLCNRQTFLLSVRSPLTSTLPYVSSNDCGLGNAMSWPA